MSKNTNKKIEEIEMVLPEEDNCEFIEGTEEDVKPRWTIKKKIIVGTAGVIGLLIGALALGKKSGSDDNDNEDDQENDNELTPVAVPETNPVELPAE